MKRLLRILHVLLVLIRQGVASSFLCVLYYKKRDQQKHSYHLRKLGQNLCEALPRLGPAFVKLGQFISTRYDLVNPIICNELKKLQDNVKQVAFKKIKKILLAELEERFVQVEMDEQPVAAASVAQVYKGYISYAGEKKLVAIKVLRPGIHKTFSNNIQLMLMIAELVHSFILPAKRLRLFDVVSIISDSAKAELNMQMEAAAGDKLRFDCRNDKNIHIPQVFWEFTSKNVLVVEWVDGKRIEACSSSLKKSFASKLAYSFFRQVYTNGFFHADIHPGNILIDKNENIVFLDFGICSFLPEKDRLFLAEIIYAFTKKDYDKVAELHFKAGYVNCNDENLEKLRNKFSLACRTIAEPIFGRPKAQISIGKLLKRLFEITSEFQMQTQPQLILLQKNMMSLEGVLAILDPDVNMWLMVEPWFEEWARENLTLKSCAKRKLRNLEKVVGKLEDLIMKS